MEDLTAWLGRHSFAHNGSRVLSVIKALKADGVQRFGSTGYCYGGRIIFDLVYAGELDVAAMSHPSFIDIADLEVRITSAYAYWASLTDQRQKYAANYKVPLLINSCEIDTQYPKEKQDKALEVFKDSAAPFNQPYFPGCTHNFAVRGDLVS